MAGRINDGKNDNNSWRTLPANLATQAASPTTRTTMSVHNHHRHFSVEQANAMLPLVRAVAKDLSDLSRDVIERRERLAHLLAGRNKQSSDLYGEELAQIEEELEKDGNRLREYVEELKRLGVEPKNGPEG